MGIDKSLPVTFVGWDSRESVAADVCAHSIRRRSKHRPEIRYLKHRELRKSGAFFRPWAIEGVTGEFTDLIDGNHFSTEFSHTRFLVPFIMQYQGWALFMDSDMIFLSDIAKLFALADDRYAVMCVKHSHHSIESMKMDERRQSNYFRKNWSSFVLWNCGHEANAHLTVECVNSMSGGDLHRFSWLKDEQIGSLPFTYNYIGKVSPKLPMEANGRPAVVHYTEGGPWFETCRNVPYAQWWLEEYEHWQQFGEHDAKISHIRSAMYREQAI